MGERQTSVGTAGIEASLRRSAADLVRGIADQKVSSGVLAISLNVPKGSALLTVIDSDGIAYEVVARTEGAALKGLLGRPNRDLSEGERAVLRRGGASEEELGAGPKLLAVARTPTAAKYLALEKSSLTVQAAAKRLGLTDGRIRQRLGAGELYGFKKDGDWRIPSFQFCKNELVPGIERVMVKVPRDLSLVALHNWLTTANADLRLDERDTDLSPLEWLQEGRSPDAVAALAGAL
jgi:hypothetical protein